MLCREIAELDAAGVEAVIKVLILSRYRQLKAAFTEIQLAFIRLNSQATGIVFMRDSKATFSLAEPDLLCIAEPVAPDGIVDARAYCCTLAGTQVLLKNFALDTRQSL